jgi:hypothetical protein
LGSQFFFYKYGFGGWLKTTFDDDVAAVAAVVAVDNLFPFKLFESDLPPSRLLRTTQCWLLQNHL